MRISSLILVASATVLLTTGCMTDDSMAKDSYSYYSSYGIDIDYKKMREVERQAAQHGGLRVTWIHLPTKKSRPSRSEQLGVN